MVCGGLQHVALEGGGVESRRGAGQPQQKQEEQGEERARQAAEKAKASLKRRSEDKFDSAAMAALERALARLRAYEAASRRHTPRNSAANPTPR